MGVELTDRVSLENVRCRACGAKLSEDAVSVQRGVVFVRCDRCNVRYPLEDCPS